MRVSNLTQKWTPEMESELMRLRDEEGMRFADIAEKLGRTSISSVEARYRKIRDERR